MHAAKVYFVILFLFPNQSYRITHTKYIKKMHITLTWQYQNKVYDMNLYQDLYCYTMTINWLFQTYFQTESAPAMVLPLGIIWGSMTALYRVAQKMEQSNSGNRANPENDSPQEITHKIKFDDLGVIIMRKRGSIQQGEKR